MATQSGEETAFYKLGNKATVFWDENQPENKKILPGQVVELVNTKKVLDAAVRRGLIEVGEKELKAFQAAEAERQKKLASGLSPEQKDVQATMIQAKEILAQAEQEKADAEKQRLENEKLLADIKAQQQQLAESTTKTK
jgi:hypothetical protein